MAQQVVLHTAGCEPTLPTLRDTASRKMSATEQQPQCMSLPMRMSRSALG